MPIHRVAAIIRRAAGDGGDFLVVPQTPPPKLAEEEYGDYVDSDLWDLPSAPLEPLADGQISASLLEGAESCADKIALGSFDFDSALSQVMSQVGAGGANGVRWSFYKYVEEPEFGPGHLVHTVFVVGVLGSEEENLKEGVKWMSLQSSLNLLVEVKPGNARIGPLVVIGLLTDSEPSLPQKLLTTSRFQEYPPGVTLIPMKSRTAKPFHTTNLVLISSKDDTHDREDSLHTIYGDALIMDPGCLSDCHAELEEVLATLPRKLVVFVTHHHYDHIDGLSVVQKHNPDATLMAHENTMNRIGKDYWSLGYTSVSGGEKICIGGQILEVIFAPGHTDGHMALLHVNTNTLVVGDHCVGQGSAVLDFRSGGNMKDYFRSTYNFMDLSAHVLIPMHGRVNLWPKRMLCGYLKHRRDRETSILKAIEGGAETLYEIVAKSYGDTDPRLWIAASSNVRLHVDYLAYQDRLPKGFSLEKYLCSYEELVSKVEGFILESGKASL